MSDRSDRQQRSDKRKSDKQGPDKQKVTLYLPLSLHRQIKIRAAVDSESMSAVVEKAIAFYMSHPDLVAEAEEARSVGKTYRVYDCPECSNALIFRDECLQSLRGQVGAIADELTASSASAPGEGEGSQDEELVPC